MYSTGKLEPLIDAVRQYGQEMTAVVAWSGNQADDEAFHAIPLWGVGTGKIVRCWQSLLIGNSRRTYVELKRHIRSAALLVGARRNCTGHSSEQLGCGAGDAPVEQLARAAQEVAAGNWNARVTVSGEDELAQLADSFNQMTAELLGQKERLVQAERVAAWRELAEGWRTS
jgi:two-component system, NtrC family, nitrogen regulation sensor histidine kinase NtrY